MELHRRRLIATWYYQPGNSKLRHRIEVYQYEPGGTFGFYVLEDLPNGTYRLVSEASLHPPASPYPTAEEAREAAEHELKRWLESGSGFRSL